MKQYIKVIWNKGREWFVLFCIFAATFSYAMFQGGFVSWFLFYSFLPFGLYAVAVLLYPLKKWNVTREMKLKPRFAGDYLSYDIHITRPSAFPVYMAAVKEESNILDQEERTIYPLFERNVVIPYEKSFVERGEYEFFTVSIEISDLLGIVKKKAYYPLKQRFIVYPQIYEIDIPFLLAGIEEGKNEVSTGNQSTTLVTGIREYQPGDRLGSIDWKATARKATLISKEFGHYHERSMIIIADVMTSLYFEERMSFLASMLIHEEIKRKKVDFLLAGDALFSQKISEQNESDNLLHHLARAKPISNRTFEVEVKNIAIQKQHSFMVIVSQVTGTLIGHIQSKLRPHAKASLIVVKDEGAGLSDEETIIVNGIQSSALTIEVVNIHLPLSSKEVRAEISE
ncbi:MULTISPECIES: DUF58 domain-containing protein [Priestia]|jgi:uncharacterized protein (DUF58 family)|uniref:DUF58 domain-containing protein n=1 Tax=Priestia TaxID=2800373 RepID=UPI002041C03E|nr:MULTISPECIES: DUF58 domain-containing protein [Priestia]MCM3774266.1 DUF58 domain-containing protein [Priestia aryabhattai]MDY0943997.1 DUF58 domain-containing protein [Priestia megaterium]